MSGLSEETVNLLKEFLLAYKEDSKGQTKLLEDTRKCLTEFKLDYIAVKSGVNGLISVCKEREKTCSIKHQDFENRLRSGPSSEGIKNQEEKINNILKTLVSYRRAVDTRIEKVEAKFEQIVPIIYKIIGGLIVLGLISGPIFSMFGKRFGWL